MRLPVRLRLLDEPEVSQGAAAELKTETINISSRGFFMQLPQRVDVGRTVAVYLRVPTEISGSAFCEWRCTGRIVREEHAGESNFGYGVEIEKAVPPER
jgi:PilZ domain